MADVGPRTASCPSAVLALASALAAGGLAASEQPLRDLRLVAEVRPVDYAYTWTVDGVRRQGDDSDDRAVALGAGLRWGWGEAGSAQQVFAGGELLAVDTAFGTGGRRGGIGRGEAGWAWSPGSRALLTVGLVGGGGWSTYALPGGAVGGRTLSGPTIEGGLRTGLRWRLDATWSLSGEAGWLVERERYAGDGARLDLTRSGPWLGLSLAWTLGGLPRRID